MKPNRCKLLVGEDGEPRGLCEDYRAGTSHRTPHGLFRVVEYVPKSPTRPTPKDIDDLARQLWHRYVNAQASDERDHYRPWDKLTDQETLIGFRALAKFVLARGLR